MFPSKRDSLTFADNVNQDQTAQNVQSNRTSTLPYKEVFSWGKKQKL